MRRLRIVALATLLTIPAVARAGNPDSLFAVVAAKDFARDSVGLTELRALWPEHLALVRGIVFGRHGRVFRDDGIQLWLRDQPWYHPDSSFTNAALNAVERANLDRIRQVEAETHDHIQPGDLRWWQARGMSPEALGPHSAAEWDVLRAEVEAVHGRRFDREAWLQRYFDERYWYAPDAAYDPRRLTAVERRNLALIDSLSRGSASSEVRPCDMGWYEHRLLTPAELRGANLATLRILRNEVYARHGMLFRAEWLQNYFSDRPWYVSGDGRAVQLSSTERTNVATIAGAERELRAALSTDSLTQAQLEGLFREDARRLRWSIYARHGRVFHDRWIQDWVETLEHYRPDPGYDDSRLTPVERANLATLSAYEHVALGETDVPEG